MELPESPNAFKGNPKFGIKTGVQRPKPLKSSTETRLNFQSWEGALEDNDSVNRNNMCKNDSKTSHNVPKVDDVLLLFERIVKHLSDKVFKPALIHAIINLNAALKIHGEQIEALDKDRMDKYQVTLREACKNSELDLVARLQLLEIIEMRHVKWKPNHDISNYYKHKLQQVEQSNSIEALEMENQNLQTRLTESLKNLPPTALNANAPDFIPPPTKGGSSSTDKKILPGMKVEIGAHRRRVKVVEPEVTNSATPKNMTNDQICPTKSPVPPPSPSGDGYGCNRLSGDYAYSVPVGNGNYINIQGNDPELTKAANLVLRDFFLAKSSSRIDHRGNQNRNHSFTAKTKEKCIPKGMHLKYDRKALISVAKSPFSQQLPNKWSNEWEKVKAENPNLFHQVVSGKSNQLHGIENIPKFYSFVRQSEEEDTSLNGNSFATEESTAPRFRTIGGRKFDTNNNSNIYKNPIHTKAKRWDESTEKWIEVNGSEKS